jgi:SAM-dependent methyltransferase
MARRALHRLGSEGRAVASVVGASEAIPLKSGSVDLVLCVNCLEFVGDRASAFREVRRVLGKGGTAIVGVMNVQSPWELTRRLKAPFVSASRSYYRRGRFFSSPELRARLESAGLEPVEEAFAVHFPPVRSPLESFYGAFESTLGRWFPARGAVILTRSVAR